MRISIKFKFFVTIGVLITAALSVVVWRSSEIFRNDKEAFVKELSAKLAGSTAHNIENLLNKLQDKLVIFISSRESLSHTGARVDDQMRVLFSRYPEFEAVGFLTPDGTGKQVVQWVETNPSSQASRWPTGYGKKILDRLSFKKIDANGSGFFRGQTPDGNWLVVLAFSVQVSGGQKSWVVGVFPNTLFQDLLSDFSTGLNTGLIVDDQGVAIADSDAALNWHQLGQHPLVKEMTASSSMSETGDFIDTEGKPIIGSFERVPQMNIAAIVTTPRDKAFEAADLLVSNIIYIGVVILVMALALAVILSNLITGPLQRLAKMAQEIGAGNFQVQVDVNTNDEIGDLANSFFKMERDLIEREEALAQAQNALVQSEKMSAFGQLSAGIAHEVKNPLAGILGHAQLALGKTPDDDMRRHLEVIEKETRRCKTIVENLMKFARSEKAELTMTNLEQVVQDTISLVDHQLSLAGCKILTDLEPCPMVMGNGNQLQQVLLNLMVNASHAMESRSVKNVTVRLKKVGGKAQIQVEDTGAGMPPEVQKKIFEPFFTTKPAGKGTGLGLSVSIGIVKDHHGEIYVKSRVNEGTTFFIDIPIPDKAPMAPRAESKAEVAKATPAVAPSAASPAAPPLASTPPTVAPAAKSPKAPPAPLVGPPKTAPRAPAGMPPPFDFGRIEVVGENEEQDSSPSFISTEGLESTNVQSHDLDEKTKPVDTQDQDELVVEMPTVIQQMPPPVPADRNSETSIFDMPVEELAKETLANSKKEEEPSDNSAAEEFKVKVHRPKIKAQG